MDIDPLLPPLTVDFRVGVKAITTHHNTSYLFPRIFFPLFVCLNFEGFFPLLFPTALSRIELLSSILVSTASLNCTSTSYSCV